MTAIRGRSRGLSAILVIGCMLLVVAVSQVVVALRPVATPPTAPSNDRLAPSIDDLDSVGGAAGGSSTTGTLDQGPTPDVARIREDVAFWSARVVRQPDDFISSNRWGIAEIELARTTGDLSAYLQAVAAFDATLKRDPTNVAALGYRGSALVSLHRFTEARTLARDVLAGRPNDPVALATLGDASLELGDVKAASDAYQRADTVAHGSATLTRLAHLAFIDGDTRQALDIARSAVAAGTSEGVEGERAAFLQYQLADLLASTGDLVAARTAYQTALREQPGSFLAHAGLARVDAADGDRDGAIDELSAAIAIVPQPDFLARRGDLYTLRSGAGDARRAADDYATVQAIARLSEASAGVYDRTLVYYLANHGLAPDDAVSLAKSELATRKDVYGYDAYAWALFAAGRPDEADAAMTSALAFGTRDAKLLYHAGMIAAARGDRAMARERLMSALALDPSFDPLQVARARQTLTGLN